MSAPHSAQSASPPAAAPAAPAERRRLLLVEDEPVIRSALRRYLERHGWAVDEADDGARGLAFLLGDGAPAYDVVLSDLFMPGMSGEAFYDAMVAVRPALAERVIVTTGDSFGPEAASFLRRTGCTVLNKPFELAELRAVVERVAGRA